MKTTHLRALRKLQKARREGDADTLKALETGWALMPQYQHSGTVAIQPTPTQIAGWFSEFESSVEAAKAEKVAETATKRGTHEGSATPRPRKKKKR